MTAYEYYQREVQRRVARAPRRFGPSGDDVGVVFIPSAAVLATMLTPTLTDTLDLERRRQRARALGVRF